LQENGAEVFSLMNVLLNCRISRHKISIIVLRKLRSSYKEFKPKYPDMRLYKPKKQIIQLRIDADVLDWLKHESPGYQTRANAILREAMLNSNYFNNVDAIRRRSGACYRLI